MRAPGGASPADRRFGQSHRHLSHARNFLPGIKGDLVTMFDGTASFGARTGAAIYLVFKVAVVAVLAYAVKQEWQQHIISATEIAAHNADITASQAREAKAKADAAANEAPRDTIGHATTDSWGQPLRGTAPAVRNR